MEKKKKKKSFRESTNNHRELIHSIRQWFFSGRKSRIPSSDARSCRSAASISHRDDDVDDICRAYYISKPTDISPRLTWPPPQGPVSACERFFVPPIMACSLVEEARLSAASCCSSTRSSEVVAAGELVDDSTAVVTYSEEPYRDFRRSMGKMVEAHHGQHWECCSRLDWEFMEKLLFCYLELNKRSVRKDILRAFTDVTESFSQRGEVGVNPGRDRTQRRLSPLAAKSSLN